MHLFADSLVSMNKALTHDLYRMDIILPELAKIANPGQFVHIKTGLDNEPLLRRPISIHDIAQNDGVLSLLYKVVGTGTALLSRIQAGARIDLMGPLGNGFKLPPAGVRVLLVGGGIGIAPLVYLVRKLNEIKCQITVLYGELHSDRLVALDKLLEFNAQVITATQDGSQGYKGLVTDLLETEIDSNAIDYIYTCGPEAMMAKVFDFARKKEIPGQLSFEEYMACGVGACLGCAKKLRADDINHAKICVDGPVFSFEQVDFSNRK